MTANLKGTDTAAIISSRFPTAISEISEYAVYIMPEKIATVAEFLKTNPQTAFNYLADLTATDYYEYFEVIYRLTAMERNQSLVLKVRLNDRKKPVMPSVTAVWKGADLMEREVYDLMGIEFSGHSKMQRIFTWEGFAGHPLRKDYWA
jgi:NADH-quinone oxidoreductase subunit C